MLLCGKSEELDVQHNNKKKLFNLVPRLVKE